MQLRFRSFHGKATLVSPAYVVSVCVNDHVQDSCVRFGAPSRMCSRYLATGYFADVNAYGSTAVTSRGRSSKLNAKR